MVGSCVAPVVTELVRQHKSMHERINFSAPESDSVHVALETAPA